MSIRNIASALGRPSVHPFPARMAPELAIRELARLKQGATVLDPMAGSGTVVALAQSRGLRAVGFDVDPLAVLMSKVWTRAVVKEDVHRSAVRVLSRARQRMKACPVAAAYPTRADAETCAFVRYWFDGYARRQLASLATTISALRDIATRDVLWCAFSRLIIAKQAGASRAMDLSHSRPHRAFERAPRKPFREFLSAVQKVLSGCPDVEASTNYGARIELGDARDLPMKAKSVDLVFTSPPYLNAIDYLRCSKFSLVWMGYSIAQLRAIRSDSIGSYAAGHCKVALEDIARRECDWDSLSPRTQGILARYLADTEKCLRAIKRVLSPTGRAVYVVGENCIEGVYVPTGQLIRAIAREVGLRPVRGRIRPLPAGRRYMPPPQSRGGKLDGRMNQEVIVNLRSA
ncbi:MAG: hypothetical protein ACYC9L_10855 [Sulfuricaulis sp.]